MKKKYTLSQMIITAAFVLGICLPMPLWLLVGGRLKGGIFSGGGEMRDLAQMPVLSAENYSTYPREFEAYLSDHMPFRDALIAAQSTGDYLLFGSSSGKVIVGKDNWLFYAAKDDGDPIADYRGEYLFTQSQLEDIAQRLSEMRDELAAQDIEFVLFLAPDKERIYSEYMPEEYGAPAEKYRYRQIYEYIRDNTDIRIVDSLDALRDAKTKTDLPLWYKTDTHWNDVGAYVGSRALLAELGIELPDIDEGIYTPVMQEETAGDLARLLHLEFLLKRGDNECRLQGFEEKGETVAEEGYHSAAEHHNSGADERRIYVCRDSYCDAMLQYIGSSFNESRYVYWQFFDSADLFDYDPDVFVFEVVERYLNELMVIGL